MDIEKNEQNTSVTHNGVISVNNNSVNIEGPRATGMQIKQAAIAQGVNIQLSFVLSEEIGDHRTKIIGDSEVVAVHPKSQFVATANDDNS